MSLRLHDISLAELTNWRNPMSHGITITSATALHLDTIGQIALTVDDLVRAKDFYQNTLGMKFLFDAGNLAFFQCGAVRLMLSTPEKPGLRGGTILYYKVEDIHAAHAALKERGVAFLDEPHLIAKMP